MISGGPNRPSGGPGGDVRVLTTLPGTLEKGGRVLYWNSLLKYMETQVMIRPSPISSVSPLSQYRFQSNLVPTESYDEGESNVAGCEVFGEELTEDVGFYRRINKSALIRIINAFHFRLCFH